VVKLKDKHFALLNKDKEQPTQISAGKQGYSVFFDIEKNNEKNLVQKSFHYLSAQIEIALDDRRLFVAIPFCLVLGVILYKLPSDNPSVIMMLLFAICLLAYFLFTFVKGKNIHIITLLISLFVGFILLPIHGYLFGTFMLDRPTYGKYEAYVEKIISNKDDGQRVIITSIAPIENSVKIPIKKARLFIRKGPLLTGGDIIHAYIRFTPVPSPVVIGGYDGQFQSYFNGIGAYASATKTPIIIANQSKNWFLAKVNKMRFEIGSRIDEILPNQSGSIAKALSVGDQSDISPELREKMSASGLAHVLAISGLHLSLVAGGVFVLIRILLALSYSLAHKISTKKAAAIVGIITALFYLALSGASVSAIRATIMLILIFGAVLVGRRALTMRNVALAAIFVIITDPSSIFRPSFQLSFAAVVALVAIYENLQQRNLQQRNSYSKFLRFFAGLASTSLIAGIATALFAAYHFQQTAPLGVLANLVALPIVAFVVLPFAFIGVILMPFGFEQPFIFIMGYAIDIIVLIADLISSWSEGINFSPLLLPIALVIGLFAFAWLAFFITKFRLLGAMLAIPLIAFFGIDKSPDILIASGTKAIAVRGQVQSPDIGEENRDRGGEYSLALISGRGGSFAVNVWQETYQEKIDNKMQDMQCDILGCFYQSPLGYSVALVKSKQAFREDCQIADLVVTHLYAPKSCKNITQVVDLGDMREGGTHWLKWENDKQSFIIRSAITDKNRPWRP